MKKPKTKPTPPKSYTVTHPEFFTVALPPWGARALRRAARDAGVSPTALLSRLIASALAGEIAPAKGAKN